jgi:hypothetical protein
MEDTKVKEAIASLMKERGNREALAEMIVEYIQPTHVTSAVMDQILNTRALNPGDQLIRKVRKGIRVWTHVPGSIGLQSEITVSERANYVLDYAIVGLLANEWDLENGDIGTIESMRTEAFAKINDYYVNKVFTALTSIYTAVNTPSNYTNVGGHVTQTALDNAIEYINEQISGGAKAIVGVRSALFPIMKFAGWQTTSNGTDLAASQDIVTEYLKTGWLGTYLGVPIVALPQQWDNPEDHNALLPTNKILVVGQDVGSFITYGPPKEKQWTDMEPTPPYWHMDIMTQFGFMIDKIEGIFILGNLS